MFFVIFQLPAAVDWALSKVFEEHTSERGKQRDETKFSVQRASLPSDPHLRVHSRPAEKGFGVVLGLLVVLNRPVS